MYSAILGISWRNRSKPCVKSTTLVLHFSRNSLVGGENSGGNQIWHDQMSTSPRADSARRSLYNTVFVSDIPVLCLGSCKRAILVPVYEKLTRDRPLKVCNLEGTSSDTVFTVRGIVYWCSDIAKCTFWQLIHLSIRKLIDWLSTNATGCQIWNISKHSLHCSCRINKIDEMYHEAWKLLWHGNAQLMIHCYDLQPPFFLMVACVTRHSQDLHD